MRRFLGVLAVLGSQQLAVVTDAPTAYAQTLAPAAAKGSDLQRQYDEAFQEMLRKPADLDVLFKFATIASKVGDL